MPNCSSLLSHTHITAGRPHPSLNQWRRNFPIPESYEFSISRRNPIHGLRAMPCGTFLSGSADCPSFECLPSDAMLLNQEIHSPLPSDNISNLVHGLIIADLDPDSAKLAIGILGPFLSAFGFLFILRIVMSWYPKLPVGKFPYVIAYAPTEPLLGPTRKLIPPLGGVDVTPVVWFGLISFLNEILVGPQGLLVLLSQQVK